MGAIKAVVTGATGLLGQALVKTLLAEGTEVHAIARPGSFRNRRLTGEPSVLVHEVDLSDLRSAVDKLPNDVDVFFHLAWAGTAPAWRNDARLQESNIACTLDAVELARAVGCRVFVGAGSQAEYGRVEGLVSPDAPCKPETAYGVAKLCAGQMSRLLCNEYDIRHSWARILSLYGPYDASTTMMSCLIATLLSGRAMELTRCEQVWDYLYADDAGRALSLIAKKGRNGSVYCIGSGEGRALREYVNMARAIVNPSVPLNFGARGYAANQVMNLRADITSLRNDTGFEPSISFEDGVRQTAAWMMKQEGECE